MYSVAICYGLIEANLRCCGAGKSAGYSVAICYGLIEATFASGDKKQYWNVFRSYMLRPY